MAEDAVAAEIGSIKEVDVSVPAQTLGQRGK